MNRRDLLRGAGVSAFSYAKAAGANERVRAGLIGCGTRGTLALLPASARHADIEIAAACDVYKPNLDRALSAVHKAGGKAEGYGDFRRILDRHDIDAVLVATPDHWHGPITVAACQAGKDVYVEKPLANSIEDCLKVVEAAAKHKRVVQVGVQQRSMRIYHQALEMIKDGKIGPVKRCSMVWGADGAGSRGPEAEGPPPDGLDWDAFQGPAPRRPYRPSRQFRWRGWWEYGSGAITDFGVHMIDVVHWFMGIDTPQVTFGAGYHSPARLPEQPPDVVDLTWKYPAFMATYSSRRDEWANTFWGDSGSLAVNRVMIRVKPMGAKAKAEEIRAAEPASSGEVHHLRNFLDCIRTRNKPAADAETGFRSTLPCLMAALSVRTGRSYRWDGHAAKAL